MEAYSSPEGKSYPARETERPREGSSASPPRNRERHMKGSLAGTHHSMSTQFSRQTTNEDFMVKRDGLGEIKTKDASTQLPEVFKGSNGWDMGKNSGKKRMRSRPKQPGKDVCFLFGCKDIADKTVRDKVMLRQMCIRQSMISGKLGGTMDPPPGKQFITASADSIPMICSVLQMRKRQPVRKVK